MPRFSLLLCSLLLLVACAPQQVAPPETQPAPNSGLPRREEGSTSGIDAVPSATPFRLRIGQRWIYTSVQRGLPINDTLNLLPSTRIPGVFTASSEVFGETQLMAVDGQRLYIVSPASKTQPGQSILCVASALYGRTTDFDGKAYLVPDAQAIAVLKGAVAVAGGGTSETIDKLPLQLVDLKVFRSCQLQAAKK